MARTPDPDVDRAINEAVLEVLASEGLGGMTIEGVASTAGVARTSVYRRYSNTIEMVEAAVESLLGVPEPEMSLDDSAAWRKVVESLRKALFDSAAGLPLLSALIVGEQEHPELLEMWRSRVVAGRIEMISRRFGWDDQAARQLGELALGGLIAAYVSRGQVTEEVARDLADLIWEAQPPPKDPS